MRGKKDIKVPVMSLSEQVDFRKRANEHYWLPLRQAKEDDIRDNLILLVGGEGCRVWDANGKEYLEACASDWTVAVGYGRKEIADAAHEQLLKIPHVDPFGNYAAPSTINFTTKLAQIAPGTLSKVFTISGGSEANESALKLARQYQARAGFPKRTKFISRRLCYHGATFACQSLSTDLFFRPYLNEPLLPGCIRVAHPYCYRCEFGLEYPSCNLLCAKQVETAIQSENPSTVAAVILDAVSVQAFASVPPREYLRDVVPDIMTLDKGISSGYLPLSAVVVKEEIAAKFIGTQRDAFSHGHTWWGHPVSCAVGLASINIIEREKLVQNAAEIGTYFLDTLHSALDKSVIVGNIQGLGLLIDLEIVRNKKTKEHITGKEAAEFRQRLTHKLLERGLIVQVSSVYVSLLPPLTICKSEVDNVVSILEVSISEIEKEMVLG